VIAASFVVFLSAFVTMFLEPKVGFLLWLLSVVMLFIGLMKTPRKQTRVINLVEAEAELAAESGEGVPFQEDGRWFMWDEGVLMAYNESFQTWYPAAASAHVRPQSLLPGNLVSRSG
jgi:hypothetical protein